MDTASGLIRQWFKKGTRKRSCATKLSQKMIPQFADMPPFTIEDNLFPFLPLMPLFSEGSGRFECKVYCNNQ
jgi:hypothetical protein